MWGGVTVSKKQVIHISYANCPSSNKLRDLIVPLLEKDYKIEEYASKIKNDEDFNIDALMTAIGSSKIIIIIISKKYLIKSRYCIEEVREIIRRHEGEGLGRNVFPIVDEDFQKELGSEFLANEGMYHKLQKKSSKFIEKYLETHLKKTAGTARVSQFGTCLTSSEVFLYNMFDKSGWVFKSTDYKKLVKKIKKNFPYKTLAAQPNMLKCLDENYLKANLTQGGDNHFKNDFTYTANNKHLFFERKIQTELLSGMQSETSKNILLLTGESGCGKTTLIRQCIGELLKESNNHIYISEDGIDSAFIESLEYIESSEKSNVIVIVEKINFKDIDSLEKLLSMVINENKFHLLLSSDQSGNNDGFSVFEKYIDYAYFEGYQKFDIGNYSEERAHIVEIYQNKFPEAKNMQVLQNMITQQKPMAFLSSIIYFDSHLNDTIKVLLKENKTILDEYELNFLDVLSVVYFFTRKNRKLWYRDVFLPETNMAKALNRLREKFLLTYEEDTFSGISQFYDEEIFNTVLETYYGGDSEKMFENIMSTYIKCFHKINTIFSCLREHNIEFTNVFESYIFRNFDIIVHKSGVHDLFDLKKLILNSVLLDTNDKKSLLDTLIEHFYKLTIEDRNAFKKYRSFYIETRNYYFKEGWSFDYKELDFNLSKYFYTNTDSRLREVHYLNLDLLIEDYYTNSNIVKYLLTNKSFIEEKKVKEGTKAEIRKIINELYHSLDDLAPIENKNLIYLLSFDCFYSSPFQIEDRYDLNLIYKHMMKKYKFDGYSFRFLSSILKNKNLLKMSYFDIDYLIENKLKGDFAIFDVLISENLLKQTDISKILDYFFRHYVGRTPILILKLFNLYSDENKKEFSSETAVNLLSWAFNVVLKVMNSMSLPQLQGRIFRSSVVSVALASRENISLYIKDYGLNSLAAKYINMMSIIDSAREKIKHEGISYEKYFPLLKTSPMDLYLMLYMEHKTYVNNRTLAEYAQYCYRQKKYGVSFRYITTSEAYREYRNRALLIFNILSNFYLKNQEYDFPKNIVANILKTIENKDKPIYTNIIKELLYSVINNNELNLREKSILDLANYYIDIRRFYLAKKTIQTAMNRNMINYYKNIVYAQNVLSEAKCNRSEIIGIMKEKYQYELGKIYVGRIKKIVDFGIFISLSSGLNGLYNTKKLSQEERDRLSSIYKIGNNVKVVILWQNGLKLGLDIIETVTIPEIAEEVGMSTEDVLDFAKNSNLVLGNLTPKSFLKGAQARGLINKIRSAFNDNDISREKDISSNKIETKEVITNKKILISMALSLENRIFAKMLEGMGYAYDVLEKTEEIYKKIVTEQYDILLTHTTLLTEEILSRKELLILTEVCEIIEKKNYIIDIRENKKRDQ